MNGVDSLQFKHRDVWLIPHRIRQLMLTCKLHTGAHSIAINVGPLLRQVFDSLGAAQNHEVLRQ